MNESLALGVGLTMVAGIMSGNCMLPMKFVRSWKWENIWLVFSVVSLIVIPWALAFGLVDNLFETYHALSARQLTLPILFGVGWGIAQVLFGISVTRLGLGLAYAIIVGLGALLGTLVPLFVQQHELAKGRPLFFVLSGVTVMVLGIIFSTWGGQIRERDKAGTNAVHSGQNYFAAILLAVLCGIMAPMLNYSFAFGQDIGHRHAVAQPCAFVQMSIDTIVEVVDLQPLPVRRVLGRAEQPLAELHVRLHRSADIQQQEHFHRRRIDGRSPPISAHFNG